MRRWPATLTHNGETRTLRGWADHLGLSLHQIYARLSRDLPVEEVCAPKIRGNRRPGPAAATLGRCVGCEREIDRRAGICAACRAVGVLVEVPLYGRTECAVVDAEHWPRVRRHEWYLGSTGYPSRSVVRAGRKGTQTLGAFLVSPARTLRVRVKNGNRLDCRRSNLVVSCGSASRRRDRTTGRAGTLEQVRVTVDNRPYSLGYWPARLVPDVEACLARTVPELRGKGLTPREVRRALDVAVGRRIEDGDEGRAA